MTDLNSKILRDLRVISGSEFHWISENPPGWLPIPLSEEFKWSGNYLRQKCKPEDLIRYFKIREKLYNSDIRYAHQGVPADFVDKIDALIYIRNICELGKENGIKAYLGQSGFEIYRGIVVLSLKREGGKTTGKKKTAKSKSDYDDIRNMATDYLKARHPKHTVVSLIKKNTSYSRSAIYRALEKHDSGLWKKPVK